MEKNFDRAVLEDLLKRRFFYIPSFEIYQGVSGFYDFGPPGCSVKQNVISTWRQHFIIEESMLEVDCAILTPEIVLKASGHTERFSDLMIYDTVTKEVFRADQLLTEILKTRLKDEKLDEQLRKEYEEIIAQADCYKEKEMHELFQKHKILSPNNNPLSEPVPFNLMFSTFIGPTGTTKAFLRPETAQGIFVNFRRLLGYAGGKVPFAVAQIGNAFRNEISPRSGLLRVREFTLAEIEHFVSPDRKQHEKFKRVAEMELTLFPQKQQLSDGKTIGMKVKDAVDQGIINNQTLAYYMARTHLFLIKLGIKPEGLRFRQHLKHEMAHYASDCWDAEILTSYGWVECVGHADRSCYDLKAHTKVSKTELSVFEQFDEPRMEKAYQAKPVMQKIGREFQKKARLISNHLKQMNSEDAENLKKNIENDGKAKIEIESEEFELAKDHVEFSLEDVKINGRNFVPGVIEPSFGIGRIIYAVFEHSFSVREDDKRRGFFRFTPAVAPVKCSILPLSSNTDFDPLIQKIQSKLTLLGISTKLDTTSTTIGKRYARTDEIGIPLAITVDFDSLNDESVTLRDRDSTKQVRGNYSDIIDSVFQIIQGSLTWEEVTKKFPAFNRPSDKD
ncbi:glycine--tRNA ligase [Anaeramoeba ignava]|uniref:Glycine--tRNA ligase n=1 Tax=Anaeramoeba ignava TaxID=1746090 RepID=A0A9Q0LSL7_ANAIG|nr:glycine--tRNA ligase [Anaeramoeba ignava]|eukprot:Anaeramoba_ignava/a348753_252.p1 GENE.a348753_252~~a348753_252.p1  ORF type:complete len:617 (-),score=175.85 a348753_252:228-2078(-)